MGGIEDRIREIEAEIKKTQYNKATEHHIGKLKAKMSKLQMDLEQQHKGGGEGFSIPKTGDATVSLIGFPNVGKSSLLNRITDADSEVGNFSFTTLRPIPGTMSYKGAQIQVVDLPGIIENASSGAGRGREILSVARNSDLILVISDTKTTGISKIVNELYKVGIVLNRSRKNISIKKKHSGGIKIYAPRFLNIDSETIINILKEFKIASADVYIRENISAEDLIEHLRSGTVYIPAMLVINKIDLDPGFEPSGENGISDFKISKISAQTGYGIEDLKEEIYQSLDLIRVYLREKSGKVDMERPLVLTSGAMVRDVARRISREMLTSFRYAIISGPKRKFRELRVGLDYELLDEDSVTVISRY